MTFDGGETFGLWLRCRGWLITAVNWFSLPSAPKFFCFHSEAKLAEKKKTKQKNVYRWLLDRIQKYLLPVEFLFQRPYLNLQVWHQGWTFVRSLFPVQAWGYLKLINHLPDRFYRERYSESPKGIAVAELRVGTTFKDSSQAGRFKQPIRCLRTYVNGPAPFLYFERLACLKGACYCIFTYWIWNRHYSDWELPTKSTVAVLRFALIRASDNAEYWARLRSCQKRSAFRCRIFENDWGSQTDCRRFARRIWDQVASGNMRRIFRDYPFL